MADREKDKTKENDKETGSLIYRLFMKGKENAAQKASAKEEKDTVLVSERDLPDTPKDTQPEEPVGPDPLMLYWERLNGDEHVLGQEIFDPLEYLERGEDGEILYKKDIVKFREKISRSASEELENLDDLGDVKPRIFVRASHDVMAAWVLIFPPKGSEMLELSQLKEKLQEQGINTGILEESLSKIVDEKLYFKLIKIAQGTPPVDGKNGEIINLIDIDVTPKKKHSQEELDAIDWENDSPDNLYPDNYQIIAAGDILARIVKPVEGADGVNVKGSKVRYKAGRPAEIPRGNNVRMSEDGSELIADKNGRVTYKNGKYVVESALAIRSDVDISTGNIEFDGDITIKGDVREGFSVKATGDVIIEGLVENANITAGGDIQVKKGVNGNNEGRLEAGGDVRAKYIENCIVSVGGSVYAENIICSEVDSDDSIFIETGKGVIVGGSCTACKKIKAVRIGAESFRTTNITIGGTSKMREECVVAKNALKAAQEEFAELERNLAYLERTSALLSGERLDMLSSLRLQKTIGELKVKRADTQYKSLISAMEEVKEGRIQCAVLYPATKITLGNLSVTINEVNRGCNIYYKDGSIHMGHI